MEKQEILFNDLPEHLKPVARDTFPDQKKFSRTLHRDFVRPKSGEFVTLGGDRNYMYWFKPVKKENQKTGKG